MDYVRFVISRNDENSGHRQGLFQALGELAAADALNSAEKAVVKEINRWFKCHLKVPTRFARARRSNPKSVALGWFKATATEQIDQMRQMAAILVQHGIHVEMVRSTRPGYIVYEDEFQIAAEPFKETAT